MNILLISKANNSDAAQKLVHIYEKSKVVHIHEKSISRIYSWKQSVICPRSIRIRENYHAEKANSMNKWLAIYTET